MTMFTYKRTNDITARKATGQSIGMDWLTIKVRAQDPITNDSILVLIDQFTRCARNSHVTNRTLV